MRNMGGAIYSLAMSPNDKLFATASRDGTVKLWEISSKKPKDTYPSSNEFQRFKKRKYSVGFNKDGKKLAVAGSDGTVEVLRILSSGKMKSEKKN